MRPPLLRAVACRVTLAATLVAPVCALAGTRPNHVTTTTGDTPLPLAQSSKGMTFTVQLSAIRPHPLGHTALIQGYGTRLRPLDSTDPDSPMFQSVESTWVVACHAGTFSIVQDRFLDEHGETVAVTSESAYDQEVPEPGSVAAAVFNRLCRYIGHGAPKSAEGT